MSTQPKKYPQRTSINDIVDDQLRRSRSTLRRGNAKMIATVILVLVLLFGYPVAMLVMWLSQAVR